jgi:hypothetical protein
MIPPVVSAPRRDSPVTHRPEQLGLALEVS